MPITPLVHWAMTSSTPDAINIGAAMSGARKRARQDRSSAAPSLSEPDSNIAKIPEKAKKSAAEAPPHDLLAQPAQSRKLMAHSIECDPIIAIIPAIAHLGRRGIDGLGLIIGHTLTLHSLRFIADPRAGGNGIRSRALRMDAARSRTRWRAYGGPYRRATVRPCAHQARWRPSRHSRARRRRRRACAPTPVLPRRG